MGGALRHTVAIKMYETTGAECGYAGIQASLTLNDVGTVLLELRASYSAKERGITRPVKTCQEKTSFHEHNL